MQVEIELIGKPNRWEPNRRSIRIGRDSSCDVSLGDYAMVSREHAVLEVDEDRLSLSDRHSANGTFVNGKLVQGGEVRSGDIIRLGPNGPELRVRLIQGRSAPLPDAPDVPAQLGESAATVVVSRSPLPEDFRQDSPPPAASAPTVASPRDDLDRFFLKTPQPPAETVIGDAFHPGTAPTAWVQNMDGAATVLGKAPGAALDEGTIVRVRLGTAEAEPPLENPHATAPAETGSGEEAVMERKLNSIRNLLAANLVVLILLLLGLFYENVQIDRNRDELMKMRGDATTAVGQFMPELNDRLNSYEKNMQGMDAKLKAAEDHFVDRMNKELPITMDKYVNSKMNDLRKQAVASRP